MARPRRARRRDAAPTGRVPHWPRPHGPSRIWISGWGWGASIPRASATAPRLAIACIRAMELAAAAAARGRHIRAIAVALVDGRYRPLITLEHQS